MELEFQRNKGRVGVGDPRFHRIRGVDVGEALLNIDARRRLGVVADPDLIRELEDTDIGATAAAGAALPDDIRVTFAQRSPDAIDALYIAHPQFALLVAHVRPS